MIEKEKEEDLSHNARQIQKQTGKHYREDRPKTRRDGGTKGRFLPKNWCVE